MSSGQSAQGQETAAEIIVTTDSDVSNGETSSVAGLVANPGDDGISLREAIEATNNDPGSYYVRFDGVLSGATISVVPPALPPLFGGGVTIDGDVDGDGDPDVTIEGDGENANLGFHVSSGGNTLHALMLEGFTGAGVLLRPEVTPAGLPTRFEGNTVDGLIMKAIGGIGIDVESVLCTPEYSPACPSYFMWANTALTNNYIEASHAGIKFWISGTGDRVEGATVTGNVIRVAGEIADTGIALQPGGDSDDVVISDVLIAHNTVEGEVIGIDVAAGTGRSQHSSTERIRVVDNRIHLVKQSPNYCCVGIQVQVGSDDPSFAIGPPIRYLDDNSVRDVLVRANSISGTLEAGVSVAAGIGGGGRRNRIGDVRIVHNHIRTSKATIGISVATGDGNPYRDRYAADNRINEVVVKANDVEISEGRFQGDAGGGVGASGIALVGGHKYGRDNVLRNIQVTRNSINSPYVGIRVIGGLGPTARRNRVICVPLTGNRIRHALERVSIRSNVDGATRNKARVACPD